MQHVIMTSGRRNQTYFNKVWAPFEDLVARYNKKLGLLPRRHVGLSLLEKVHG